MAEPILRTEALTKTYGERVVTRARDGRVVTRENQVRVSEHLRIQLSEGELRAGVLPQGDDFLDGLMETDEKKN